jgi:hypothetical protein
MTALGTRATLVHVRRLKLARPSCSCCGDRKFFHGPKGYSRAQAVVVQIYVAPDVPLGDARKTAPAVMYGGVWGRREIWRQDCYLAAGEPYGPLIRRAAA